MSDGREGEMEEEEHAVHQFQVAGENLALLVFNKYKGKMAVTDTIVMLCFSL